MSFPPATEMFQFAGFASLAYGFSQGYPRGWVAPFGDPGINDRSHLPRAFRSVPRPSSPLSAKASTRCPYFALERHTQRQGSSPAQPWGCTAKQGGNSRPARSCHRRGKTLLLRRHFARDPKRGLSAAYGLPLRSHNSLLYDCQSATCPGGLTPPAQFLIFAASLSPAAGPISRRGSPCLRSKPRWCPVVEVIGIEPTTPCLQSRCSPS